MAKDKGNSKGKPSASKLNITTDSAPKSGDKNPNKSSSTITRDSNSSSMYIPKSYEAFTTEYHTAELAKDAIKQMKNALADLKANDLDAYVSDQLRNDYSDFVDYNSILDRYNKQSDASWELSRQQQMEALNKAESANYANTKNAVNQMRRNLIGSASSGGNVGAANATALQALLGLGQQNTDTTTEGMQNWQNTSKEAAAARAANAVSALDSAREGMNSMYGNATSAYGADHTYGMQGLAESYGNVAANINEMRSQEAQNDASNLTELGKAYLEGRYNKDIADITGRWSERASAAAKTGEVSKPKKKK